MPLFQTSIPINHEQIKTIVKKNWNLNLGKILKASQNHTFQAYSDDMKKYSVRVTPDPTKKHVQRIKDQLQFVQYLVKQGLKHQVSIIHSQDKQPYIIEGDLIIVIFQWARGVALNFFQFKWLNDESVVAAWGRYFGQLHKISKKFTSELPQISKRIQNWDEVHSGVLKGIPLCQQDIKDIDDVNYYGVLHGDLNSSNIFYEQKENHLSVYDTDQVQRGFYQFDIAQAIIATYMIEDGGLPISGQPYNINKQKFITCLIQNYQKQGLIVNKERLNRMIEIKKKLYVRFALQSQKQENVPMQMKIFLTYIKQKLVPKWKK